MLNSLKEKIIPSLISTLLVGLISSFITFKVMAYQVSDMQTDMTKKADKELLDRVDSDSKQRDSELSDKLSEKADKDVLNLIYEQVKTNGRILESMRTQK